MLTPIPITTLLGALFNHGNKLTLTKLDIGQPTSQKMQITLPIGLTINLQVKIWIAYLTYP